MSAMQTYSEVQFRDQECLLEALKNLGFEQIEVSNQRNLTIQGYGRQRQEGAEVVVSKSEVGRVLKRGLRAYGGLGFVRQDGALVMVADHLDVKEEQRAALKVAYARAAVNKVVRQKRATILSDQRKAGVQTIRVRLYAG